ncbi:RNA polymerase sigma factor [Demequina rhizosphaerae]|uniref:RNA polymerase sigma factor n=1 Tax=Demequina rhizosphaerae TaxID=1638985 RepID=UPI0012E018F1|nr:sigma factor-like helix-turn-helix DNA-binding protein [Demequina rhizosphaerae]
MRSWARTLDATMRASGPDLLAYAERLTGDPDVAATLLEDALTRTFGRGRAPETRDDARVSVRDALRRAAVRRTAPDSPAVEETDPFVPPEATGASSTRDTLALLAPRERAVLAMRYADGLAVPAIAASVGLHEGAVREALTGAVTRLLAAHPRLGLRLEDALEGGTLDSATVAVGGRP